MTPTHLRAWLTEERMGVTSLLVMVALVLTVGFCLFDGHAHDDSLDLCLGMLVSALVVLLVCRALPSGTLPAFAPVLLASAAPHVLDPPPRLSA